MFKQVTLLPVGYESPTAVTVKSFVFRGIALYSPLEVNQRFNEHVTFIFKNEEEIKQEAGSKESSWHFLSWLTFQH